jgi:hypothetical protein
MPFHERFPNLRCLAYCHDWGVASISFKNCPGFLEVLHLKTNLLDDKLLGNLAARCRSLRELRVEDGVMPLTSMIPQVTRQGLQSLLSNCLCLQVLCISQTFVGAVSASDWSGLLQDRPLKELQLSLLSGELVKVLGRMESLQTFRWEGASFHMAELRDQGSILKKHGQFETLEVVVSEKPVRWPSLEFCEAPVVRYMKDLLGPAGKRVLQVEVQKWAFEM